MNKMVNGVEVPLSRQEVQEFKDREAAHQAGLATQAAQDSLLKRRAMKPSPQEQLEMIEVMGLQGWKAAMESINELHDNLEKESAAVTR